MSSLDNPKTWVPYNYMDPKDCSQGFCTFYCPQWCYIVFPPPPPTYSSFSNNDSGPNFSPLVTSVIGILASAFLLVSYYAIISKYCGNTNSSARSTENQLPNEELDENQEPSSQHHEPWQSTTTGLDEALIKSITVYKYKKNDGMIDSTDCSVCLGEFEDDEALRLLPKCNHAFHVACIDTWLNSNSNCPLCRANVAFPTFTDHLPIFQPPPPVCSPTQHYDQPTDQNLHQSIEIGNSSQLNPSERIHRDEGRSRNHQQEHVLDSQFRAFSDLGDSGLRQHTIIEVRDGSQWRHTVRRSFSMDHSSQSRQLSIADILHINQDEENCRIEECRLHGPIGHSMGSIQIGESSKPRSTGSSSSSSSSRSRVLHCVMNSVAMKRSLSSGRSLLTRHGKRTCQCY